MEKKVKKILVCGAGGFIGSHVVDALKSEGNFVIGADVRYPMFTSSGADEFYQIDLTGFDDTLRLFNHYQFDEVYQFAADMGGAGYINSGENDDQVVWNSMTINLNVLKCCVFTQVKKVLYASSACVYPESIQMEEFNPGLKEEMAYPAQPDCEYGWEKLFSERLYKTFQRKAGIQVRISRFHNIFGENGTWEGGREKAPAAVCRKVAMTPSGGTIEVWGDGEQTRSFLHISEALEGIFRLMESDHSDPINIGSDELISINKLVEMASSFENKDIKMKHLLDMPQGVRGRNSDNEMIEQVLGWRPRRPLEEGLRSTYFWIKEHAVEKYGKT